MRQLTLGACLLLALAVAPAWAGYAGTAWFENSYGDTSGGEFIAHPSWSANFPTFCVERNEILEFGDVYDVDIDPGAIRGGNSGGNPDTLDPRTAWLFCEFSKGTLSGYDYGAGRVASANALQYAIWLLEGEATQAEVDALTYAADVNAFVALAAGHSAPCTQVMNLWSTEQLGYGIWNDALDRYEYQSLLVCIPAPAAVLLGVIGIGLVGWVKRRLP